MKSIMKKIDKSLKGLDESEKKEIRMFYDEIINDRVENGETLEEIERTIDFNDIRNNYSSEFGKNDSSVKADKNYKMLFIIVSSILWVPLGIGFLAIIFSLYAVVLALGISILVIPFSSILFGIDIVINQLHIGDTLVILGAVTLVSVVAMYLLYTIARYSNILAKESMKLVVNIYDKVRE